MDIFEAIKKRHSYRGEFECRPVPRADLEQILDAAIRAPSGCNAQTTSFVVVDERRVLDQIAALADKPCLRTAAAMIVCVVDHRAVYGDMSFGVEDCAASVENMLLAITALGYASVWLDGMLRKDDLARRIAELLGIPDELQVRILLPVGVPREQGTQRERLAYGDRVFYNRWET